MPWIGYRASPGFLSPAVIKRRTRKLIGTVVFLLGLAIYATLAAMIGSGRIALAPQWVQLAFFVTAGLAWVIPAGLLIRWMQRPD
jgi:hypothetical protein